MSIASPVLALLPYPRRATRRLGCLWLAVSLAGSAWALNPEQSIYQYRCENWSRRNGLPVNSVTSIAQTNDGYIWLGTQQGLVRFDGHEFTSFSLPRTSIFVSQNISTLSASQNGGLWFGLREGAAGYFDGESFRPLGASFLEPNMQVFSVREMTDQSLWLAWNFGYARWDPRPAGTGAEEKSVGTICYRSLYQDRLGRVWLSAVDPGAVYYWENGNKYALADQDVHGLDVYAFAVDAVNRVWVGTQMGLRCFDAQLKAAPLPEAAPRSQVNALLLDHHGMLWIGTEGEGLFRYDGADFTRFTTAHGLANDYVTALFEDVEGNLWIATRGGVTKFSDVKFPLYGPDDGLAGEPLGLAAAADGGVWVATARGISRIDGRRITTLGPEVDLVNQYAKRVWQAGNGDLYVMDGNRGLTVIAGGRVVSRHLLKEWPIAFAEDQTGLIVSFGPEIYRVTRDAVMPWTYKSGVPPPMVWVVNLCPARDGSLWAATHRGVWQITGGEYRNWSVDNGLSGTVANWVFEDTDGTIWAGLASGIARFRNGQVQCLGREEGLFDNFISAIVPDDAGWFWVDSSAGIFRVRRDDLNAVADGRVAKLECEAFNGPEAVKSNDKHAQEPTAVHTKDGRIWFATAAGVVAIDPAAIPRNEVPPRVYIQYRRINGEEVSGRGSVTAKPGPGDLEFGYTALSFGATEKIRFRYRLMGYDERWVSAQARRSAFYTNLKPGDYTFEVQACNADGVWSPAGDKVQVMLPPHLYQTGWFRAAGALLGLALVGAVYGWRINALRRRQRMLQEMNAQLDANVQRRTAELATANRQLTEEVAERKRFEHEAEKMNQQLLQASREAGMAEVATSVLHNVGNVLNSVNVSVSLLGSHLRDGRYETLAKVANLLGKNAATPGFLTEDEKGRKIPAYLERISEHLVEQQATMSRELLSLRKNVAHIEDIVQMQQSYSRLHAARESLRAAELFDDAVRLSGAGLAHCHIKLVREIDEEITVVTDKSRVLQVLVNLLRNAIHACAEAHGTESTIFVRARRTGSQRVAFDVSDNGVGIAAENLSRLFTQGFTTRKDGHGYGLHSSALTAKAMDGTLSASSAGPGRGATFTFEIPTNTATACEPSPVNGSNCQEPVAQTVS